MSRNFTELPANRKFYSESEWCVATRIGVITVAIYMQITVAKTAPARYSRVPKFN